MRRRNSVAGLVFAAFVLMWLKLEELMASLEGLLSSMAEVLSAVPVPFWIITGLAILIGTVIVSGALLMRLNRREPPPSS